MAHAADSVKSRLLGRHGRLLGRGWIGGEAGLLPWYLEFEIVELHLDDLALNKLPKIAKEIGTTDRVRSRRAGTFLRHHLNPHPGSAFFGRAR